MNNCHKSSACRVYVCQRYLCMDFKTAFKLWRPCSEISLLCMSWVCWWWWSARRYGFCKLSHLTGPRGLSVKLLISAEFISIITHGKRFLPTRSQPRWQINHTFTIVWCRARCFHLARKVFGLSLCICFYREELSLCVCMCVCVCWVISRGIFQAFLWSFIVPYRSGSWLSLTTQALA